MDFFYVRVVRYFAAILKRLLPFTFVDKQVLFAGFPEYDFAAAGDFHTLFCSFMSF